MIITWVFIFSFAVALLPTQANAGCTGLDHEAWLREHHRTMEKQRAAQDKYQRELRYRLERERIEREETQRKQQQKYNERIERNRIKQEKHQKKMEKQQRDLHRRLERDRKQREFEQLRHRLKMAGPESCKKIKNFEDKVSKYPVLNNIYGTVTINNKVYKPNIKRKYETFECTDNRYGEEPFHKLVTIETNNYGSAPGLGQGGTSSNWLYYDKDWEEFEWEPDMEKYKQSRPKRHRGKKKGE